MNPYSSNLAKKLEDLGPKQISTLGEFVDFLRVRRRDRALARAAAAASTPAFEAFWGNLEDDVYDAL